eukprot:jgi/Ulvmu1/8904/UM049_0086.1
MRAIVSTARLLRSARSAPPTAISLGNAIHTLFTGSRDMGDFVDSKWWDGSTVALVTGSNKGIGFEIARHFAEQGLSVIITARNPELGQAAITKLKEMVPDATSQFYQLDITDAASVSACAASVKKNFGKLDILVNNAGIAYKGSTFGADEAAITIDCNLKGTRQVTEAMLPLIKEAGGGRVVNVASRSGMLRQLRPQELRDAFTAPADADAVEALAASYVAAIRAGTHSQQGWSNSMYGVSKLAEISYTKWLAAQLKDQSIGVYACCPGYCVTDMTSGGGNKTARDGADTPVWLALQPLGAVPQGGFFGERKEVDWTG